MGEYEERVLAASPMEGVVLRYGFFYGPGTWYQPDGAIADLLRRGEMAILGDGNAVWSFVHIDDAITATVSALTAAPGVYNVVDDHPTPVADWLPAFAQWANVPPPPTLRLPDALKAAGAEAVHFHTGLAGASNQRAKDQLGFAPRPLPWRGREFPSLVLT